MTSLTHQASHVLPLSLNLDLNLLLGLRPPTILSLNLNLSLNLSPEASRIKPRTSYILGPLASDPKPPEP